MSWAPEVIADSSGKWCGNALRFATREEALKNVANLRARWMMVIDTRAVESPDPANYRWDDKEGLVDIQWCAGCGEPWPCSDSKRTDISGDERAKHRIQPGLL